MQRLKQQSLLPVWRPFQLGRTRLTPGPYKPPSGLLRSETACLGGAAQPWVRNFASQILPAICPAPLMPCAIVWRIDRAEAAGMPTTQLLAFVQSDFAPISRNAFANLHADHAFGGAAVRRELFGYPIFKLGLATAAFL